MYAIMVLSLSMDASQKKLKIVEGCVVCFGVVSTLYLIKSIAITVGLPNTIKSRMFKCFSSQKVFIKSTIYENVTNIS